ncbi:phycobiliprotein lyase [Lyngbya confervoides]|uniref:Chromophore lyase CpcS/CpeS n=1 Tax=Lyngbya confervoides BDU141951 TaxID=1574623 RepID=A0ABD4T116_9CYAN|nr:phycobiliprotein lyase [Lyngbya confervoides]MCM1982344.1 phycobiliprotein lyase [Lyngbya confervoides BDU141951]
MDVMEFFQRSAGRWRSQRATHHLAFRRAELGDSCIEVLSLMPHDSRIVALCELHGIDPALAVGGSAVQWLGAMGWDREGEGGHEGQTAFAIVPDAQDPHQGRLLRERGYAEIVPVVGRYSMDSDEGLVLTTDYETMSAQERFWFADDSVRFRTSTVKRFGGFSTTSFCAEVRISQDSTRTHLPQGSALSLWGW